MAASTKKPNRPPMTPDQRDESRRLGEIWDRRKREWGKELTQELAAEYLNISQGAVWQYVRGKIPLNTDKIIAFASLLKVAPQEIRPKIGISVAEPPPDYPGPDVKDRIRRMSREERRDLLRFLADLD